MPASLPAALGLFSSFSPPFLYLPPHCSSNTLGISLPLSLCTGWCLGLELSFPEYLCSLHAQYIQVSSPLSLLSSEAFPGPQY